MATRIIGDEELRRKLKKLADMRSLVPSMEEAALHVKGKVSKYPQGNQHRPQEFKTDKSRRFFFWALKAGVIEVPYRRGQSPGSEDHGQSWTIKGMKNGLQQIVGSDTSYGELLQSEAKQTSYHRQTGWRTVEDVTEQEEEKVLDFLKRAVDKLLAG